MSSRGLKRVKRAFGAKHQKKNIKKTRKFLSQGYPILVKMLSRNFDKKLPKFIFPVPFAPKIMKDFSDLSFSTTVVIVYRK